MQKSWSLKWLRIALMFTWENVNQCAKYLYFNFSCLSTSKNSYTVFVCVVQYHHNSDAINRFQLSQPSQGWIYLHVYCSSWLRWISNTGIQAKWSKEIPSLKGTLKLSIPKPKECMAYLKISQLSWVFPLTVVPLPILKFPHISSGYPPPSWLLAFSLLYPYITPHHSAINPTSCCMPPSYPVHYFTAQC